MKKNKIKIIVAALVLFSKPVLAQDIHFSQFNSTPQLVNPALTGIEFDWQAFLNYKNQWSSVTEPYTTFAFSFEKSFFKKKWKNGYFGTGIFVFRDKAGDAQLTTTQASLSISSGVKLDEHNIIAGGIQGAYIQKAISPASLK